MQLVCTLLGLYLIVIFARILLSWVRLGPDSALAPVASAIVSVTEPVMGPFRRVIPPMRFGGAALDLSPIVLILLIQVVQGIIC